MHNRHRAQAIKSLRAMIANTDVPDEKQALQAMLERRLSTSRSSMPPADRLKEAIDTAAEALLKLRKAETHLSEAKDNHTKAAAAHAAAAAELKQAKIASKAAKFQASPRRAALPTPQHAFQQAATWLADLQHVATDAGANVVIPKDAMASLLSTLQQCGSTFPCMAPTASTAVRQLAAPHHTQDDAMLSAHEQFDLTDEDDASHAEGFRMGAESDPGDHLLGKALKSRLHPTRGRRLVSKAAGPSFVGSAAVRPTIQKR